jgi:two-component system phosphate regulon sensor histidine kinase PhoR
MRSKLMGSYLVIILVMGVTLFAYLNQTLERYMVGSIRENLQSEARLAALMASREVHALRDDAPRVAGDLGRTIRARATIMTDDGEVVGDSELKREDLAGLENHRNRPEVQAALQNGSGDTIRYSATLRTDMLYVALPFTSSSGDKGIIRLALPLSAVARTTASLHASLGIALLMATLLSLILSYLLSNVTSRTLRDMAASAVRFGTGDFRRPLPVSSNDELGELARVMNEMAERLETQMQRLSAEKDQLDAILRGMGEGLLVIDAEGTVTLVNPAFRTLFSLPADVAGAPLMQITRHPALHETFRTVVTDHAEQWQEITLAGEEEKTILTHWVPLLGQGALNGVVAVFHDISALKRLERIRKDFVANVSHELRTPVTVIKGYTETLQKSGIGTAPETVERFLAVIHTHADRLAHLIGDLLTLSELESAGYTLTLHPVALPEVAATARMLLEQKAAEKEITINPGSLPGLTVLADVGRLEQVLVNLLDNAVKYTPSGGTVDLFAREAGDEVEIAVRDTGQGIPPQDLPRIFERFYRVDAARSRQEGGTGLGLAIVKHIVQLHGGTVRVESVPGKGTTFFFTLRKA